MNNPRLQDAFDTATWISVAILVVIVLVLAVGYVFSLLNLTAEWVRELFQLIAATAVGLLFGHHRGTRIR